jgi:two-component system, NtrC family, sensor kinase
VTATAIFGVKVKETSVVVAHNHDNASNRTGQWHSLAELASGVAHEINNPINGIINYAQILINRLPGASREHDLANRIIQEGERIAGIVQSLYTLAGVDQHDKEGLSPNELLTDCLQLTRAQLLADGIHLVVDMVHNLPMVYGNRRQLMQVFLNLISNARQALNEKHQTACFSKLLQITATCVREKTGTLVRMEFYDQGPGISEDLLERVLLPFVTTRSGGRGAGLGLSASHTILQHHNSCIRVESTDGAFTRVTVDIPSWPKQQAQQNTEQTNTL